MSRTMYDAVDLSNIPVDAEMVGTYINGNYASTPEQRARFTDAVFVFIDALGNDAAKASVLDVEKGDATPETAATWIGERDKVEPGSATIYCNRDTLPAVRKACGGLTYSVWLTTLDGDKAPGQGYVAVQFQGGMTAPYDVSVVYDDNWHPTRDC